MKALALILLLLVAPAWARPSTIFEFGTQLQLQESQTQSLRLILTELAQQNGQLQARLLSEEQNFRKQVSTQAELGELHKSLDRIRDVRVQLRLLDVTVQRKLESVLSPRQLQQWRQIQAQRSQSKSP